jgi:hypothetical protein
MKKDVLVHKNDDVKLQYKYLIRLRLTRMRPN